MRITNKFGLPDAIVRAVKNDGYTKGDADYSVSDLITPPRVLALRREYWDDLEEDASDRVWSLFGQAVHHIADRANLEDIAERRLYWTILGKTISGQMDNYKRKTGVLSDYKTATVSKFSFGDFKDWEEQQNIYAQLLRWHDDPINRIEIIALVRDHRPREAEQAAKNNKSYPQKSLKIELPLWPEVRAIAFIKERITLHERAKKILPECSPQERWASASAWAIRKYGQKNAVNGYANIASEETAKKALETLGKGHYIEHRPGRNRRCEGGYCIAARFCSQFKSLSSV